MVKYTKGSSGDGNKETEDDSITYAKELNGKYFVLLDLENLAYNPNGITKATGSTTRHPAKFAQVNKSTFDSYLKFLRNGSQSILNSVRRQVTYG